MEGSTAEIQRTFVVPPVTARPSSFCRIDTTTVMGKSFISQKKRGGTRWGKEASGGGKKGGMEGGRRVQGIVDSGK